MIEYRNEVIKVQSKRYKTVINPTPSLIDLSTWKKELSECKSSFGFQVYIICGIDGFKIWIGEEDTANIVECFECEKSEGIYR